MNYINTVHILTIVGKFLRRGVPDVVAAARSVLNDWNSGKIKYCTQPPETEQRDDIHVSASIVRSDVLEFDVDNFEAMETEIFNKCIVKNEEVMEVISSGPLEMKMSFADIETKKSTDPLVNESQIHNKKRKTKDANDTSSVDPEMNLEGNMRIGYTKIKFNSRYDYSLN